MSESLFECKGKEDACIWQKIYFNDFKHKIFLNFTDFLK